MIYNFRYKTASEYIENLKNILQLDKENDEYNELMDEFMIFYEVSGSGS